MKKTFVYGVSVDEENFIDRVRETQRLKNDFENGTNVILISPRRMGKTSLVKHVINQMDNDSIQVVYLDIYDCRSEYDFYNRLAVALLKQTATRSEQVLRNIKDMLSRLTPKISFSPDSALDFSISLGITPKDYSPEEILSLPEQISKKTGKHIVICIDEFQQIGEFPDTISVQKRLRGAWQLQKNTSYCLFGSKKHILEQLFQSKKMPFFQFGDMLFLDTIPAEEWVRYICRQFKTRNMTISETHAKKICDTVHCHSSYVQQLAWNVMLNADKEVDDSVIEYSINDLINQNVALFMQQTAGLTTYQMNMLRTLAKGINLDLTSASVLQEYNLGSKSNISRLLKSLTDKELIEKRPNGVFLTDVVFQLWIQRLG